MSESLSDAAALLRDQARRKVKAHPTRQQILALLSERPGASITDVCKVLGAGWGTVQHHLYLLRRAGLVKSIVQGRTHVFFGDKVGATALAQHALLLRSRVRDLVHVVMTQPGIGQRELTERISMSRKVLRGYVDLLQRHHLLEEVRRSKFREYFPTRELVAIAGMIPGLSNVAMVAPVPEPARESAHVASVFAARPLAP